MAERILAWHFLPADGRLAHRQGGKIITPGMVTTERRPLRLCGVGLHASVDIMDALGYAPGPIVQRVECGGRILHGNDKLCCSWRRCIAVADASRALRLFAADEAERACELAGWKDPRSLAAIEAAR
ncbi:MAG TPA: hypothetical protein VFB81_01615, partial [Myxococcales bacterium]|nr:hypothetical protein [Myxococcales bacterium]